MTPIQRLGQNHGGYRGQTIDIRVVLREIEVLAKGNGWHKEVFHRADEWEWFALRRCPRPNAKLNFPRFYLSAGIHGDEPAGPLAMLELLSANPWPEGAEILLVPCLNPPGLARNCRENPAGLDLNRDYLHPQSPEIQAHIRWLQEPGNFTLSLCLHEDWEAHGFYLYELNPDQLPTRAEAMIAAAAAVGPIDHSEIIEGRPAQGGIIRPTLDPRTRPKWPESFWLLQHKTRLAYTLEAASDYPLPLRVAALTAAVRAALAGAAEIT